MKEEIKILLIVLGVILVGYFIYFIISIFFMMSFSKKLKTGKKAISILLYQKRNSLLKIIDLIDPSLLNEELIKFKNENINQEYKVVDPSLSREIYLDLEDIYKNITFFLDKNESQKGEKLEREIIVLEDINRRYFSTSQMYNTNIIAYNYRRNLSFTKLLKTLFRIKEKEPIK